MGSIGELPAMSCFDDLMQFRDDVEEAMKKIPARGSARRRKRLVDPAARVVGKSQPHAKSP